MQELMDKAKSLLKSGEVARVLGWKKGESEFANKEFFDTDKNFKPAEFMHFCSQMLVKEPKNGLTEEELESGDYGLIKDEQVGGKKKSQLHL